MLPHRPLLRQSKSFGPSAPIAYATSASPPNEAAAWPVRSCRMGDKAVAWPVCRCWVPDTTATWLGVPFLQFIAHTNPSSRQLQGTLACAMICRKATFTISFSEVMLPDANFLSSRAQNRGFCAFLGFGTLVFGLFEHKIEVFVRFCPPEPPFSGLSSTKSRFLCAFRLRNPHFRAFRAQNRHFCARVDGDWHQDA